MNAQDEITYLRGRLDELSATNAQLERDLYFQARATELAKEELEKLRKEKNK